MAKALELNPDTLAAVPSIPQAARVKASLDEESRSRKVPPKIEREPLQVRWPVEDVKAAKLAAIQMDFSTVSDFMLACFHAYMKNQKA
jgi:hypothetical protein